MPCLLIVLALISPRLAIVAMWLLSDMLERAFDSWLLPLVGFLLVPWTTLAYALMWSTGSAAITGFEWFVVVLAFLFDLGAHRGSARRRR